MKVLVFGNMGSGKTTVTRLLRKKYRWAKVAIDDFRRKYGDGTKAAELRARKKFFEAAMEQENQFVECTGIGKVAEGLLRTLKQSEQLILCLILHAPSPFCKSRIRERARNVPFPQPFENAILFIDRNHIEISKGMIEKMWSKRANTIIIERDNITKLDLKRIVRNVDSILQRTSSIK